MPPRRIEARSRPPLGTRSGTWRPGTHRIRGYAPPFPPCPARAKTHLPKHRRCTSCPCDLEVVQPHTRAAGIALAGPHCGLTAANQLGVPLGIGRIAGTGKHGVVTPMRQSARPSETTALQSMRITGGTSAGSPGLGTRRGKRFARRQASGDDGLQNPLCPDVLWLVLALYFYFLAGVLDSEGRARRQAGVLRLECAWEFDPAGSP